MTTPRDAIGLSERLRERVRLLGQSPDSILKFMDRILPLIEEAATALDALQARAKELEAVIAQLDERCAMHERDCHRLQQERDEAYERAAKVADEAAITRSYPEGRRAATAIAAAIRRLAAGTEKEGE